MSNKFVYFIRPIGMDGPIKIGCSALPADRLHTLMYWSPFPLEVITSAPGGFDLERLVHSCFAPDHLHHEWFAVSPQLLAFIDTVKATGSLDAARDLPKHGSIHKTGRVSAWTPERRLYMSYTLRINAARKRMRDADENAAWDLPEDVGAVMTRWAGWGRFNSPRQPTAAERDLLDQYLADPKAHSVVSEWRRKARAA